MTRAYKVKKKRPRESADPIKRGELWQALRMRAGYTYRRLASLTGLNMQQIWYRVKVQQKYRVEELVAMRTLFDLSWQEFGEILETIASD